MERITMGQYTAEIRPLKWETARDQYQNYFEYCVLRGQEVIIDDRMVSGREKTFLEALKELILLDRASAAVSSRPLALKKAA